MIINFLGIDQISRSKCLLSNSSRNLYLLKIKLLRLLQELIHFISALFNHKNYLIKLLKCLYLRIVGGILRM